MPPQSALRNPQRAILAALFLAIGLWLPAPCPAQDDPFAAGVRTTPWLSPADEQKAFKLPARFEINLVAAEPDIQKPLNMAFDERGRIWLTCTVEYPYAAPQDRPGKDSIRVLEDTDGDGRFEKVTTFADGLNIPIGIYPYKGGCIAYSIPNIWHFEDTDGDGVCDKRTVLYGPFDTSRDTHGMVNSFRRGFDGWVYACHGFNNDSRVKGKDGNEVHMQSGNTFRFRLDGSRIEHFTHGQVNPFGMCFDELFNIFTADCHSKPLTQLIRGGYYPSFGKPHDGLGFVPSMMEHSHGSTAICGVTIYTGENFPAKYRGLFYSGNVMTSRINCNKPEYHGSTIKAIEQPDFLSTSDPWFRPVDIHIGPDGAMYILDFYNRIIGHYEVPLPHPGRDRTSGRIWRVAHKQETGDRGQRSSAVGNALRGVPGGGTYLTKLTVPQLIDQLDSPQLEHRLRVLNYLCDEKAKDCVEPAQQAFASPRSARQKAAALWLLKRSGALDAQGLSAACVDADREVRLHALKSLAENPALDEGQLSLANARTKDEDPFVRRTATAVLGPHATASQFGGLLQRLTEVGEADVLLRYATRMTLRDILQRLDSDAGWAIAERLGGTPDQLEAVANLAASAQSPGAAALLVRYLGRLETLPELDYQRLARNVPGASLERLVAICRERSTGDLQSQAMLIRALAAGLAQRDPSGVEVIQDWAMLVSRQILESNAPETIAWNAAPIDGLPPSENPWVIAARPSNDGDKDAFFYYSLPKGEQRTGIYRSGAFDLPEKLTFWCAGHSGPPGRPLNKGNYVRLRDAKTHEVLAESRPPRNDTARRFEWDLSQFAGKQGFIELIDGDTGGAYAWLAVGRFSLPALNPGLQAGRQQLAAEIVGRLKLAALRPHLATLLASPNTDGAARAAIAQALVALEPDARCAALAAALADPALPDELRPRLGYAITVRQSNETIENLREVMKRAPAKLQATLADALAGDAAGANALLALIESGHAAPRLLLLPNVRNKLGTISDVAVAERVAELTSKLPPVGETIDRLLVERRAAFAKAAPNLDRGVAAFTKHCAACHQIAGQGAVIGPQLDGIGLRGIDRLLEDTLDPNRNVDVAFRTTTIRTKDGQVLTGLVRRDEGAQLVLADAQGKELALAKAEIDAQQKTALSLMPANVAEVVPVDEFFDLLGHLLAQKKPPEK